MHNRTPALMGLAKVMRLAFNGDNLCELTAQLSGRVAADARDAAALLDLSIVHQLQGKHETALELQWQALQMQQHYRLQPTALRPTVRVLAIMGPGEVMANTPIEFLLEDSDIALELLYVGAGVPPVHDIPTHDVAFVAVCESDVNQQLLSQLKRVLEYWPKPHINPPAHIAELARDGLSQVLSGLRGVNVVSSQRVSRAELAKHRELELCYPLIARPANSHAGHGLSKLDCAADADRYVEQHQQEEFSVAPFVDYRTPNDGLYRKYRVAMIEGHAYPAHMAVSPRWMVHYLNADMVENAANRAAEAHFMDSFDWEFGARHRLGLAAINQRLGLDYYSLDLSLIHISEPTRPY